MKSSDIDQMQAVIDKFNELHRILKNLEKALSTNVTSYAIVAYGSKHSSIATINIPVQDSQTLRNLLEDMSTSMKIEIDNLKPDSVVLVQQEDLIDE